MSHHISKTISNNAYWQINKHLARTIGLEPTLVLQHLIDLQTKVFKHTDFFQSTKDLMQELNLSKHHVQNSVGKLKKVGVLIVESKSYNNKNHYTVLLDRVEELLQVDEQHFTKYLDTHHLDEKQPSSEAEFDQVVEQKLSNHLDKKSPTHIKKNKAIKANLRKELKKNTIASQSEKNILQRYLDDCIQFDDNMKFKRAYNEIIDYGGFKKVFKVLDFTDSQITNWSRKIDTVYQFSNA